LKITVIKKDGSKEPWDGEKLSGSIATAASEAGLDKGRIKEVVSNVSQKVIDRVCGDKEVTSYMIRGIILEELDHIESVVADAWRKYELVKKKAP